MDMKKSIIIATLLLAMTGCQPTGPMFYQEAFSLNYAEIAGPNFLITESDAVGFDYIGVASLYVIEATGNTKIDKKKKNKGADDIYGDKDTYYYTTTGLREANTRSALAFAVEKAKELGGDGIIRLRTNLETDLIEGKRRTKYVEVQGMVIKRK
jgi:uncharacterized protein YbjQ (UPF0145 family)